MPLRKNTSANSPHSRSTPAQLVRAAPMMRVELSDAALAQSQLSADSQVGAGANVAELHDDYARQGLFNGGYARHAIRLERTLGWVLWICLAAVLVLISL